MRSILFLIALVFSFLVITSGTEAYLVGGEEFDYRIIFRANTTESYPLRVSLNLSIYYDDGNISADCNDTRFTNGAGTLLDFWIPYCYTTDGARNTTLYFEPDANLTDGTIYLYYGNSSVSPASNGSATFHKFDSFEDGDISDMGCSCGGHICEASTAWAYEGSYSFYQKDTAGGNPECWWDLTNKKDVIFGFVFYITNVDLSSSMVFANYDDGPNNPGLDMRNRGGYFSNQNTNFTVPQKIENNVSYFVEGKYRADYEGVPMYLNGSDIGNTSRLVGEGFEKMQVASLGEWFMDVFFDDNYNPADSYVVVEEGLYIPISINITSPTNTTYYNTTIVNINFTTNGNANGTYNLDDAGNVSIADDATTFNLALTSLTQTTHKLILWATNATNSTDADTETVYFTIVWDYITYPDNTTYYNHFIFYNVSESDSNSSSHLVCWFILNDAPQKNYTCGTFNNSINSNIGVNNFTWFYNDSGGTVHSVETFFTIAIICNSTVENDTICGGLDFSYIISCERLGYTTYQFDYSNMSYCEYGCIDGTCINRTFCLDQCIQNETMCNKDYIIKCEQKSDGCWGWTNEDQTFCKFGCLQGTCLNCTDFCNTGDAICIGNTIQWCDDDNGDGCMEYSVKNTTFCEMGCKEVVNVTTQYRNVTCNYHSFDEIYIVRDAFTVLGTTVESLFPTLNLRVWIITILMIGVGGFAGVKTKNWRVGLMIMSVILFGGAWVGWVPWVIFVFFALFVGGVWFVAEKGKD